MRSSICIGVISYLPDEEELRKVRIERLEKLMDQCDRHFNLPVLIIAQNWGDYCIPQTGTKKVYLYKDKLGITIARMKLREKFLASHYQYMIMLDDDMELSENQFDYDYYLRIVKLYHKDYYYVGNFLNNFSCISKSGFKKVNYDEEIDPEQGTGFEDWVFNVRCKRKLSSYKINSNLPAGERKKFLNDEYSTWTPANKELNKQNDQASKELIKKIS